MSDVAILHDQLDANGGAERVAYEMARALDAPIFAMWDDADTTPDDIDVIELSGRIGDVVHGQHYLLEDIYQMIEWQHVEPLYEFDTIIQNKTNPHWFVPHADSQAVIRYLHSTPRNLYDLYRRRGGDTVGDMMKTVQRMLYQQTTTYADAWICNSEIVRRRLNMYWDKDSQVIHPPVNTEMADPRAEAEDYIFRVGRLASNKRIPLLRRVAEEIDTELIVAGTGECKNELLAGAPENLTYVGYVDESTKFEYMSRATATLFLGENEDFGIVPIESMAAGTPVVGPNEGYTKHQIKHGENGYLTSPTVADVVKQLRQVQDAGVGWSSRQLADFAKQFCASRFRESIRDAVGRVVEQATIQPAHKEPIPVTND
jgi:glycosyltransferase involved in cell wall biosynthesis